MTDEKIIYLLENGATYDMYIVEIAGTTTKIGDTAIDLSSYLKTSYAESAYLKKTEATSTYATQTSFNNHITDRVAHLTQLEKNKLLTTDNISANINSSSDNTQVPSAKATYDLANTKANTNHTHNTSDIKGLSIPTKVSDLENDRGYLTSIPSEYITETELNAKGYLSHQEISNLQYKTKATLITNTTTLKLDVTKKNKAWNGTIKLTYFYPASLTEIEMSFISNEVRWAVISGQKYVKNITFTQDSSNTAHYTIGIQLAGNVYGGYQAEVIAGFADINSLTSEAFTGAKTAVYYSPWGKNNGVTLVSAPEDLELTFPCTSVQLAQAMKNKFNIAIKAGAIGVFNCEKKTVTITDAPSDYGLLHIETFAHDRMIIRFDGVSGSSYKGSWIGQIIGSKGIFSGITWSRLDNESRISELEADVNELFQSVSNGKTLVANAITGKGVSTPTTATFATMATNISKISGCKEETKSYDITSSGLTPIILTFSANVLGVKQVIPPTYSCRINTQTSGDIFTINGKELTFYVNGAGTWKVTALIK